MDAYSIQLRSRVIEAYDRGEGTQIELAERFAVSERWIQKLLRQRRDTRSILPLPWNGGRKPIIGGEKLTRLQVAVAAAPDASLAELRDKCEIDGSIMCVARALRRLRITRKKSRCSRRSSRNRGCKRNVRPGGGKRRIWTPPA